MYVDADALVAMTKPDDRLKPWAEKVLSQTEPKYTSAITFVEVQFVLQREEGSEAACRAVENLQRDFPEVKIIELDKEIMNQSISLRQKYGLSILDAVHAATALNHDGRIASTDEAFDRVLGITRISQP